MVWKRIKSQEEGTKEHGVIYWFENSKINAVASLVNRPDLPDMEIRIGYGKYTWEKRITIPVSKSIGYEMSAKRFLGIVKLHLKRHGVKS